MANEQKRSSLLQTLFPESVPRLWCPLVTHYSDNGTVDSSRTAAHIRHMRPYISCFLAPGSTGDGWEMNEDESRHLIDILLQEARVQDFYLMIGVLRTEAGAARKAVEDELQRMGISPDLELEEITQQLKERGICGFTVTAPKGAELSQDRIYSELDAIAAVGAPLAIYQLPQITDNEFNPQTFSALAAKYPNIYLCKDTSGKDLVALSGAESHGVLLVRGAEGSYAEWLRPESAYFGFLLSTANCFAAELSQVIQAALAGKHTEAAELSGRVSAVVTEMFDAAASLSFGNPFANANKAIDHHFAYGADRAVLFSPPMTHSGNRLPVELVELAGAALKGQSLYPEQGYMPA